MAAIVPFALSARALLEVSRPPFQGYCNRLVVNNICPIDVNIRYNVFPVPPLPRAPGASGPEDLPQCEQGQPAQNQSDAEHLIALKALIKQQAAEEHRDQGIV